MADNRMFDERQNYQPVVVRDSQAQPPEKLVPDTPHDAIGRYLGLLLQWEDLTRQQAQYEQELKQLEAKGDTLKQEWDALAVQRRAYQTEIRALNLPLEEVIEQSWDTFKAQLWAKCQTADRDRFGGSVPTTIKHFAEPITRNPRLTE